MSGFTERRGEPWKRFRQSGETSGFPELRRRLVAKDGFSLSGYHDEDISPKLEQAEYDRFKTAYEASPDGQAEQRDRDECSNPTASNPIAHPTTRPPPRTRRADARRQTTNTGLRRARTDETKNPQSQTQA